MTLVEGNLGVGPMAATTRTSMATRMSSVRLTSLLLVEERLLEAKYFALQLAKQGGINRFGYQLNAFLSAARSVTFLIQKEMARVPGFREWWECQRRALACDSAACFFLNLRNFSQKEGRVSLVGCSVGPRRWSYRFAGNTAPVPSTLLDRDVAECCHEHVAKLARIVLACADVFPYYSCPRRAITVAGLAALSLLLEDVEDVVGLPRGWTDVGLDGRLDVLRAHVDGVDFGALERIARWKVKTVSRQATPSSLLSEQLATSLVRSLEGPGRDATTADLVAALLLREVPDGGAGDQ